MHQKIVLKFLPEQEKSLFVYGTFRTMGKQPLFAWEFQAVILSPAAREILSRFVRHKSEWSAKNQLSTTKTNL